MLSYNTLLTSQEGKVFSITLNRPDDLNPLSKEVLVELAAALDSVKNDCSVGVLIISPS